MKSSGLRCISVNEFEDEAPLHVAAHSTVRWTSANPLVTWQSRAIYQLSPQSPLRRAYERFALDDEEVPCRVHSGPDASATETSIKDELDKSDDERALEITPTHTPSPPMAEPVSPDPGTSAISPLAEKAHMAESITGTIAVEPETDKSVDDDDAVQAHLAASVAPVQHLEASRKVMTRLLLLDRSRTSF